MDIPEPQANVFTVYSKSGCPNCLKVKQLLKNNSINYTVIDCDEYLLENKDTFLQFISNLIKKDYKMFPMVFDGTTFIGGFAETNKYIEKLLDFDMSF
jgi:glutaredoxin